MRPLPTRLIHRWLPLWRRSLQFRLIVLSFGLVSVMSLGLFVSLERLVAAQANRLHEERVQQVSDQFRRSLVQEARRLLDLTELAASDADLQHAAYYHLYLQGERVHPQNALQKVADHLHLQPVLLVDERAPSVVAARGEAPKSHESESLPPLGVHVARHFDEDWLVARAPVQREGQIIASLVAYQQLDELYDRFAANNGSRLSLQWPATQDLVRLDPSLQAALPAISLNIDMPNAAEETLSLAKRVLAIALLITAILLAGALAWITRRELRPLTRLEKLAASIGAGHYGQQLAWSGDTEVGSLVRAFNTMSQQLQANRARALRLQQQERLAVIGRMAAQVAHDLNNPLSVITNTTRLLQRQWLQAQPAVVQDLDMIHHHAQRCSAIATELLQLGRPIRLSCVACDLNEALTTVVARFASSSGTSARFECSTPGRAVSVLVDPLQWERCVVNLLQNAVQACPEGRVRVELRTTAERVQVCVSDDGPGFDEQALQRLFEPFYTTKPEGSGLGLSIVQAIMQAHGGGVDIRAGSSTVCLWLPLAQPETTAGDDPQARAPANGERV